MAAAMVNSVRCGWIAWALFLVLTTSFQAAAKISPPIAKLRDTVSINLDNAETHYARGLARERQGELDAAIAEYREAIRLNPTMAEAHVNLGVVFVGQGNVNAAIAEFREAIRFNPNDAEARSNLGFALASRGELDAAIAECREAIRLAPNLAPAHVNLGMAHAHQGKVDVAIAEFREAIRLDPNLAPAHGNLGAALVSQGKLDAAIAEYREAIRFNPFLGAAHVGLGIALADQGRRFLWSGEYNKALKAYREALRVRPDDANVHVHIAYTHFLATRFENAVEEFENYFRSLDSPYGGVNSYIITWQYLSLKSIGKDDEAQKLLRDFALGFQGDGWELSVFRYHQGRLSETELVSRANERGEQCEAYFYIGYQHLLRGDKQKARAYFQKTMATKSVGYPEHIGAQARLQQLAVN